MLDLGELGQGDARYHASVGDGYGGGGGGVSGVAGSFAGR